MEDDCIRLCCTACSRELPLDHFHADRRNTRRHGRSSHCKDCQRAKTRESMRKRREAHRDEMNAAQRKWRAENKDRSREHAAKAEQSRVRPPGYKRRLKLKVKYQLEEGQFEQMVQDQDGVCAICLGPPPKGKNLCVDHCHDTGRVRGLLCQQCNSGIGMLRDDPDLVASALQYLRTKDTP